MGIDHFNSWIIDNYKESLVTNNSVKIYDYIYIDINHLLHNSIYEATDEKKFRKKLGFYLNHIFNRFICTKTIILAIDGSSPYSKLMIQRKRRIQMLKNVGNIDNDNQLDQSMMMNSMHITPGTKFMEDLNIYLNKYIAKLKKDIYI